MHKVPVTPSTFELPAPPPPAVAATPVIVVCVEYDGGLLRNESVRCSTSALARDGDVVNDSSAGPDAFSEGTKGTADDDTEEGGCSLESL